MPDESILKTLQTLFNTPDKIAEATKLEHQEAVRLHGNMLIVLAHLVAITPLLAQIVTEQTDSTAAEGDRIQQQKYNMVNLEDYADTAAGNISIAQNIRLVHTRLHVPTIADIADNVDLDKWEEAATTLKKSRVMELRNRLDNVLGD